MDKKNNVVMIVERSNANLNITKAENGKGYILEGIFTQFGVLNNNKRIYEEAEFLPHLEYLTKKMSKGRLIGELDHPKEFDISLDKASHIIEELKYDKDSRTITGRVRLLSTPAGQTARSLIDDGVQLSISSRAAGVVREDNKVEIKRVFTYDLVADPGFDNAQLNRINESLGISKDNEDISIFEMNMSENDLNRIINITDMTPIGIQSPNIEYIKENNTGNMDKEFVSIDDFTQYSNHIREEFTQFEKLLKEKDNSINELKHTLSLQERYLGHIEEETNSFIQETQLNQNNDELIEYANELNERNQALEGYVKYLSESLDKLISYSEHQTNEHNQLEEYIDGYLAEQLNDNEIETVNSQKYMRYIAELLDRGLQYSESIGEEVNYVIGHNDVIVENINGLISYSEYLKEKLNVGLNFANYIGEEVNKSNGELDEGSYFGINENRDDVNILIDNSKNIGRKIDNLLESVQKQKTNDTNNKADIAYFNLLSESKKREFLILSDDQKQKVSKAVKQQMPLSEHEFVQIWESVLTPPNHEDYVNALLENMPNEYRPIWETLDEQTQDRLIAQSKYSNVNISNPYAISNFWATRSALNQKLEFQPLNEAEMITENEKNQNLGYQNNYMNTISQSLDYFNKRHK